MKTRRLAGLCLLVMVTGCAGLKPIDWSDHDRDGALGGDHVLPAVETCTYVCSWNGIPAGRATFTGRRLETTYETVGDITTTGLAAAFYGLDLRFEGESTRADLQSRRWHFSQAGKKSIDVVFSPGTGEVRSEVTVGEETRTFVLTGNDFLDPLGAIHALRRSRLEPGRSFRVTLFAEESAYATDILVVERATIRVPAGEFETLLVRADLTRLEDGKPVADHRPQAIWITDDERRIPVKVDMKSDVGRIVLTLRRHEAGPNGP